MPSEQVVGYYTDEKKRRRPITKRNKRGYTAKNKRPIEHHSKYSRSPGDKFSGGRSQTLPARQMWLLTVMCKRTGVDTKMIDPTLDYWENKNEIERLSHVELHLKPEKAKDKPGKYRGEYTKAKEEEEYEEYKRSYRARESSDSSERARDVREILKEEAPTLSVTKARGTKGYGEDWVDVKGSADEHGRFTEEEKRALNKIGIKTGLGGGVSLDEADQRKVIAYGEAAKRRKKSQITASKRKAMAVHNIYDDKIMIKFDEKPPHETLEKLKNEGYRYNPRTKVWTSSWSMSRVKAAEDVSCGKMVTIDEEPDYASKASRAHKSAQRHLEKAEEYRNRREGIARAIPPGQPILIGHHSERKHRRDLERMDKYMKKEREERELARKYSKRASRYEALAQSGDNPATIKRRIEKLEADERRYSRELTGARNKETEKWASTSLEHTRARLNVERRKYTESGGIPAERMKLEKGDLIDTKLGEARVMKVNRKTVKVEFTNPALKSWKGYNIDKKDILNKKKRDKNDEG